MTADDIIHQTAVALTCEGHSCVLSSPLYLFIIQSTPPRPLNVFASGIKVSFFFVYQMRPQWSGWPVNQRQDVVSDQICDRKFFQVIGPLNEQTTVCPVWISEMDRYGEWYVCWLDEDNEQTSFGVSQSTLGPHKQQNHEVEGNQKHARMQAWNNKWPNHTHT